jgi:Beta-lactamase
MLPGSDARWNVCLSRIVWRSKLGARGSAFVTFRVLRWVCLQTIYSSQCCARRRAGISFAGRRRQEIYSRAARLRTTITLLQMLHQTSGFRDFFDLLYFSGLDASQFNSPGEILKLIVRQKGLNNVPGDEWIYSHTNYFLLGIVVERATKKTLAEFADENIFRPLGMAHTRFYDDASIVVPERVAAYDSGKNGSFLVDWSTTYAIVGAGGLMTNVDDLATQDRIERLYAQVDIKFPRSVESFITESLSYLSRKGHNIIAVGLNYGYFILNLLNSTRQCFNVYIA